MVFTDPRNKSNCPTSANKIGIAREKREAFKNNKYRAMCHSLGYSFMGIGIEIFGSMSDKMIGFISDLVYKASERSHIPFSILLPYWTKRLSMNIQKGNAKYFMNSSARMTGSDTLHDASVLLATHHVRIMAAD